MSDTLYQIDPATGTATRIGQIAVNGSGVNQFVGSAFVGGTLYGFTTGGQEYSISLSPVNGNVNATLLHNITSTTNTATAPIVGAGSSQ
jgi:hypothetical protein